MKFEKYRTLFVVAIIIVVLLVVSLALSFVVALPSSEESFSEMWLLGPDHTANYYPFNVTVNEEVSFFLGVGNQMGDLANYRVYTKLRNQTQPIPDIKNSVPSSLDVLYEFQFLLEDDDVWETPITFKVLDVSVQNESIAIESVLVNGQVFDINCEVIWDSENGGFYFQLFFELWIDNSETSSFQFHDRFVGIWFNVTNYSTI